MSKVFQWLRTTTTRILDPGREQRVAELAGAIGQELSELKRDFNLSRSTLRLGILPEDVPLVVDSVYEASVQRAWRDEVISPKERATLDLIGRLLELPPQRQRKVELRTGLGVFQQALGKALADGALTSEEIQLLTNVANGLGTSLREVMVTYFKNEGESLLRSMFTAIVEDGKLSTEEWQRLVSVTSGLGLSESELRQAILPQAERLVEHVLADAKADERLTEGEQRTLVWLLNTLALPESYRWYVENEIQSLLQLMAIMEGRLPSISASGIERRSGEIAHFHGPAVFQHVRNLASGVRVDRHDGVATITDCRLLFASPTRSFELNHRKVISLIPSPEYLEVRSSGKGAGFYSFGDQNKLALSIYRTAVGKANQTIIAQSEGGHTRHIPRDVRQRVWQRYAGRCADCQSDQYLEFDHIVPVAKGGNNTDNNVQLLCRRCNSKKSSFI
jgi:hypothetical protein